MPLRGSKAQIRVASAVTLAGYFLLLVLLLVWIIRLDPPVHLPRSLVLAIALIPLLFPLRGLLHGRRYTHQWVSMFSLFYFLPGVHVWFFGEGLRAVLGATLVLASLMLFSGSVLYSRWTSHRADAR